MPLHDSAAPSVTLLEVARRAGVAKSTASRALSNPDRVSVQTVARVRQAAAELRYVSHGIARALATRSTRTVGAVIPTLDNAIYAVSTLSLEKQLQKEGYLLLVACHEFDLTTETQIVEALLERGVDALVLVGLEHRKETMARLERSGVPYVLTWNRPASGGRPAVGFDNREAGRLLADYLIRLGHRDLGVIAGITRENDRARARLEGVRTALGSAGIALPAERVVERAYSIEGGRDGLSLLLAHRPGPTAVICGNDILAIGALHEARIRRLLIPDELSVAGFDDTPLAEVAGPPLTTVHFPMVEVGVNAALHVLRTLGRDVGEPQYQLPVRLVVRQSTAAPPPRARARTSES